MTMPWYIALYVGLFVAFTVYSAIDYRRNGRSVPFLLTDAGVNVVWIYFCVAAYHPSLAGRGRWPLALLFVAAIAWTVADACYEQRAVIRQRPDAYDPELSERANLWIDRGVEAFAVVVGLVALTPAIILAIRVIARHA